MSTIGYTFEFFGLFSTPSDYVFWDSFWGSLVPACSLVEERAEG